MRYRALGGTGLEVSEIGFGCGGTAGLMINGSFEAQLAAVSRALELGINYFDEAPDYGDGVSETNLGKVLKELGADPIVTTKVEVRNEDRGDIANHVERSVEASLRRLGREYVDVVQIHNGPVEEPPQLEGRDYRVLSLHDYLRPDGALDGLRRLKASGKARHIGFICRGDDGGPVRQLIDTGEFSLVNIVHTLLNPTAAYPAEPGMEARPDFGQVIPYAHEKGVGVAVYSPLASGVLSDTALAGEAPHPLSGLARRTGPVSDQRARQMASAARFRVLSRQGQTLAQAAFRFVLSHPGVTMVLGGFSDLSQLEEVASTSDAGPLSPEDTSGVEAVWSAPRSTRERTRREACS